jgi:peptidoglycan/LPS O-acetylase OafA/YrhL
MELLAPSITKTPSAAPRAGGPALPKRLPFIDNLRWVMIVLVIATHAAVTYSNQGLWYYTESMPLTRPEQLFFFAFEFFMKTFRMPMLFFLAGYFVPGSFDRKGSPFFLKDRCYRLGWPTLLYMFLLGPVTGFLAAYHRAAGGPAGTFLHEYARYITQGTFLRGFGPLWYCIVLLAFSFVYAGWRMLFSMEEKDAPRPFPGAATTGAFMTGMALVTFLARIPWPVGTAVYNLQFGYFPQYIAFFLAGTMAYRHNWLTTLPGATGRRWARTAIVAGPVGWMVLILAGGGLKGQAAAYLGGWHWQSLALSTLEAFIGVAISLGCITLFRDRFNSQGRLAAFFSANFFAVYVFHATVLVALARALAGWHGEALLKFAVVAVLAILLTYTLSAIVFRRLPLLRDIL